MDLAKLAADLYGTAPGEFTKARNDRAKQVQSDGNKSLANEIRGLVKPSAAAWVINMLTRHQAQEMEQLLALGESLRQAQENLDGAELRELTKQRRQLTSAITSQGRALAEELGQPVSDSVAYQVHETLDAALIDEDAEAAVHSGLLTRSLSANGLDPIDASGSVALPSAIGKPAPRPRAGKTKPAAVHDDGQAVDAAKQEVEQSAAQAAKAQKDIEEAQHRIADLLRRRMQIQGILDELRRRLSDTGDELEAVEDDLASAEKERAAAERAEEAARRTVDKARAALAALTKR